ncbi:ABC transporter ATP-binding protein [Rickettsiella endosymbiont of Dermanyssus gallinae]|uniref:ABC transporter ATP-binding protein n=1 Tax=Rickettsiella endosymbiont of Dermanyssus gallinae TaxID=2856608 RepID=UPI001C52AB07|nr:ABC transporter ATP-binding protein [Rickettsiella endosymbiont of Dermanyssus gallinae]
MKSSPAITISNACLQYQNQILFDQLNFHIPAGQTTCLLGPSGIGKTSLLQLIAKLNTSARADITASDQQNLESRIAYMPQSNALLPWLSVENNALLGYRLRGKNHATETEKAKMLLQQFGLTHVLKKYPAQLSGGMQQRVALARVLLENKPVILMDEPFSSLDTITRYQLQTLSAQSFTCRTVLLITHDPLEALRLGHHIAIMSGQPAQIEYLTLALLEDPPPRSLSNPKLLQWQSKLLDRLKETY